MPLGDTYYFKANIYAGPSPVAGVAPTFIGERNVYIPYADTSAEITAGYIIKDGLIRERYEALKYFVPEYPLLTTVGPFPSSLNTRNFFPNIKGPNSEISGAIVSYIENISTGKVMRCNTRVGGTAWITIYETMSDAVDLTSNFTDVQDLYLFTNNNNGSGDFLGDGYPVVYTAIDQQTELPISFRVLKLNGISSIGSVYYDRSLPVSSSALSQFIGADIISDAPDPYAPGGYSGTGGGPGTGTFDLQSDAIPLPPLPTVSFAATGFTRIYNPTLQQLNALANYLWTDATFLDTVINHLKQLLENPMDAVISLSLLPCPIPNGSPENVKVMYIGTGVYMAPATTQFVDVDCGTYQLKEFYGSALDYNPYTKVHCYLPYIGQVTLDTDEVMGRTLHVMYRIDIVTGMCAAVILVDGNALYQFSGHCAINMPLNSADFSGYIGAAMTAGKMVAGVVAGATGNMALAAELTGAPAPHSSTTETTEKKTERNPKTGRQVTAGTSNKTSTHTTPGASFGEMSRKAVANTVGSVMGGKVVVEHAGGFTGNSGYLAVRRPYLIIERPRMCNPEEYGKYNGRPSMIYMPLSNCSGYTEVQGIHFDGIPATNPELSELSELLKSGVIF